MLRKLLVPILLVCMGCAPAYYAATAFDLETTLACKACPEGNPLMPNTKNRAVLYGYSTLWAVAFTMAVEHTKHKKLLYTAGTVLRLVVGTLNLRYLGQKTGSLSISIKGT